MQEKGEKKAKRPPGRPRFEPTPEQVYSVELMASIGIPHDHIAAAIGIDADTLKRRFADQLANGKTRTIAKVADSLVRQALAGNVGAACFWLKTQAGWRETSNVELTGKDGGPIQTEEVSAREIIAGRIAGIASRVAKGGGSGGTDGDAG